MENPQQSTTTTLELKYILEKNSWNDFFCSQALFHVADVLDELWPFGGLWLRNIGTIFALAMLVNLILAQATRFGRGKIVRDLCATKVVRRFLMLHPLTSGEAKCILRQIELGVDWRTTIVGSISFRTANELELLDIVIENAKYGVGYAFMFLMMSGFIVANYFVEQFQAYFGVLRVIASCYVVYTVATNGLIAAAIKAGHGKSTHNWCRWKAASCFLMLHYHTGERARLVLQKLESERQEHLQRIRNAMKKHHQVGVVVPFVYSDIYSDVYSGCCGVCLEEYKKSEKVRILRKCKHCFHADCFMRLLYKGWGKCPLCNVGFF